MSFHRHLTKFSPSVAQEVDNLQYGQWCKIRHNDNISVSVLTCKVFLCPEHINRVLTFDAAIA